MSFIGDGSTLTNLDAGDIASGTLPVARGGTGTASPSLVAGTGISVTGTWPNQTVAASGGGVASNVQTFTSSGTWTKPTGTWARIQLWGGGGSGCRCTGNAGGGGGGGYLDVTVLLSSLGATETVTIGAGGAARFGFDQPGAVGGTTTFAGYSAYGGGGGGRNFNYQCQYDSSYGGGGGGARGAGGTGSQDPSGMGIPGDGGGGTGRGRPQPSWAYTNPFGGGGGGGGHTPGYQYFTNGGSAYGGGGGGGGSHPNTGQPIPQGGVSLLGGTGGTGARGNPTAANPGSVPGGGGGGAWDNNGGSGAGAAGKAVISVF